MVTLLPTNVDNRIEKKTVTIGAVRLVMIIYFVAKLGVVMLWLSDWIVW